MNTLHIKSHLDWTDIEISKFDNFDLSLLENESILYISNDQLEAAFKSLNIRESQGVHDSQSEQKFNDIQLVPCTDCNAIVKLEFTRNKHLDYNEYTEYNKIERHIQYSNALFKLTHIGKHIIQEIQSKKMQCNKLQCKKYDKSHIKNNIPDEVCNVLSDVIKPPSLSSNMYSSFVYFLDELLYFDAPKINYFVIEDDQYPLSFMYFNQSEWNGDHVQENLNSFVLDNNPHFSDTEALLINCFITEYISLLEDIEDDIYDHVYIETNLERRLVQNIQRLKEQLETIKSKLTIIITKYLSDN